MKCYKGSVVGVGSCFWHCDQAKLPLLGRLFAWGSQKSCPEKITLGWECGHCWKDKRQAGCCGWFFSYLLALFVIRGLSLTPLLWALPHFLGPSRQIHRAFCRDPRGAESCFCMEVFRESIRKWEEVRMQERENMAWVTSQLKHAD